MDQATLHLIIAIASFFVGLLTLLWRIQVMTNKQNNALRTELSSRIDQMAVELRGEIKEVAKELSGRIDQVNDRIDQMGKELRAGQVHLSNCMSRLEGMLGPKPWDPPPAVPTPAGGSELA